MKAEDAYRTITEAADLLQVPASVLRFWETQFHQIKPTKRMGRRYYQASDMVLLARIRDYLYKDGFTIKGVQKRLRQGENGTEAIVSADVSTDTFVREITDVRDYLADFVAD